MTTSQDFFTAGMIPEDTEWNTWSEPSRMATRPPHALLIKIAEAESASVNMTPFSTLEVPITCIEYSSHESEFSYPMRF